MMHHHLRASQDTVNGCSITMFQYFTAATYSNDAIVKQMIVLMSDAFQASKNMAQECFLFQPFGIMSKDAS